MEQVHKTSNGFTLIELLVVIAIIAILAAILFPVFAATKDSAKRISDLSNARQIGLAVKMYTTDSDGTMPIFYAYNSDPNIYTPAVHHGTEVLLLPYTDSKLIFKSPLDLGSKYLSVDPGVIKAGGASTYWQAYGTSYRFDHCMFTTVANESSQDNSFQIYNPFSQQFDVTNVVNESSIQYPAESRMIRLEMMPFFAKALDPGCVKYGYDCPPPYDYYAQWSSIGGSLIYADSHAISVTSSAQFDNSMVSPDGHRGGDASSDPNGSSWYYLCD